MGLSQQVITGAIGAFSAGVLFHIVLPGSLGVVLAAIASALTILDPLYAGARIQAIWSTLKAVLILHTFHAVLTATIVGGLIGSLSSRLQFPWLYPVGAVLSVVLHYCLFFLFAIGLSFLFAERNSGPVWGISLAITTLIGPIIGLVSVFVVQRWGT